MQNTAYSHLFAKSKIYDEERRQIVENNKKQREQQILDDEIKNTNFWERLGATIADTTTEMMGGLLKGVEGIVDAFVSVAGGLSAVFGADTTWAEDFVKYNATDELYYKTFENNLTKYSFWNDTPIVKDILGGVGQMLPTILLAPTGFGWVGVAGTIISAGGTGVEEALNEDADFGQALFYGISQAGIEGVIEGVTYGMGKGITSLGKSVTKSTGKTVAKTIGKAMIEEGVSEGIEEGLSVLVNPLAKTVYKGDEALDAYSDMSFYQNVFEQALVGGIVGTIASGASGVIAQNRAGGQNEFSISQSVQEINKLDSQANNLQKNNKLTTQNSQKIFNQKLLELENISKNLNKLSLNDKKDIIQKNNLQSYFNEDGTLISDNSSTLDENGELLKTNRVPVETDNVNAYTPNTKFQKLSYAPTKNQITEGANTTKNILLTLNENAKIVITDQIDNQVKGFYDSESKTYYISNNASEVELAGTLAVHEFTHSLEGTKQYNNLKDYIKKSIPDYDLKIEEKQHKYSSFNIAEKNGTTGEVVSFYEAETEVIAEEVGKLLSNPKSIQRIVNQNKGLASKILQGVKDLMSKLNPLSKKTEYFNYLKKVENLYSKAIKKSVGGISLSQISSLVNQKLKETKVNSEYKNVASVNQRETVRYSIENNNSKNTKNSFWGYGYDIKNLDVEEYNLIQFKDDKSLNEFAKLLEALELIVQYDAAYTDIAVRVRDYLYDVLRAQEGRTFPKLVEINNAMSATQESYILNDNININQEFIKNLGYNGVYVKESSKTNFESVIYDLKNKKKNLLKFSPKKAKERLDKAIEIFGETKNPKKAGWLLTDGRFVDYNRDSANIMNADDDFVLDYHSHDEIEMLYTSKKGTDAIDAFMAEGNIRLMPEAGGIELRNKPTIQQIYSLKLFIDNIIDERGISLDLYPPNSSENVVPDSVFYSSEFSTNKIISDIDFYYNNGYVPKVINGARYSITDSTNNTYKFKKLNSQENARINKLIKSIDFINLDDKAKTKAISFMYRNLILALPNNNKEDKLSLFSEAISLEYLSIVIAQFQLYDYQDKNTKKKKMQEFIQNLSLTAPQKYMLMGYLGYSNKYGKEVVKKYIESLKITKNQKEKLLKLSGY